MVCLRSFALLHPSFAKHIALLMLQRHSITCCVFLHHNVQYIGWGIGPVIYFYILKWQYINNIHKISWVYSVSNTHIYLKWIINMSNNRCQSVILLYSINTGTIGWITYRCQFYFISCNFITAIFDMVHWIVHSSHCNSYHYIPLWYVLWILTMFYWQMKHKAIIIHSNCTSRLLHHMWPTDNSMTADNCSWAALKLQLDQYI